MTAEERGGYCHLLFLQWQEGSLPGDAETLMTLGSIRGSPAGHPLVLEAFPVGADGMRRNEKCAAVRAEAEGYLDEQARKSALGVAARKRSAQPVGVPAGQPGGQPGVNPSDSDSDSEREEPSLRSGARGKPVPGRKAKGKKPPGEKTPRKEPTGPEADCRRFWDSEWARTRLGTPEESVTPAKQARLIELALTYLAQNGLEDTPWRIDVIAIVLNRQNEVARLNHIRSAVGG